MYYDSISVYFQYFDGGAISDELAIRDYVDNAFLETGSATGPQCRLRRANRS